MTPAIKLATKLKLAHQVHQYQHDSNTDSYGLEASEKLGVDANRVFKTLVVSLGKELVVAIVPVNKLLDMKQLAKSAGAKKASMADAKEVERTTGYVLGGVSPLGQKKRLKTYIDHSASEFETIFVSAGRRGLEIELSANDLFIALQAAYAEIAIEK